GRWGEGARRRRHHQQHGQNEGPRQAEDTGHSLHPPVLTTSSDQNHLGVVVPATLGDGCGLVGLIRGHPSSCWPPPAAPSDAGTTHRPDDIEPRSSTHFMATLDAPTPDRATPDPTAANQPALDQISPDQLTFDDLGVAPRLVT